MNIQNNLFSLNGKRALIIGGMKGIGLGMAKALDKAGASVIATTRNVSDCDDPSFKLIQMDVTSLKSVQEGMAQALNVGKIDILVCNAGIYEDHYFGQDSLQVWNNVMATNLTGIYYCIDALSEQFKKNGKGKIITVGSMYSYFGHPHSASYTASKTGVVGLTKAASVELGPYGIQVNCILPGWFKTDMNGTLPLEPRGEEIRRKTPLGRWGEADDIAGIGVFLAGNASDFITGAVIPVDGGYLNSDHFLH